MPTETGPHRAKGFEKSGGAVLFQVVYLRKIGAKQISQRAKGYEGGGVETIDPSQIPSISPLNDILAGVKQLESVKGLEGGSTILVKFQVVWLGNGGAKQL